MIPLCRLNKRISNAAPINTIITNCYFSGLTPAATPSSANNDDLISAAGRRGDFAAVRRLISERLSDGCLITTNTFKFIATNISALDDVLQNLADLDNWFTRKHAHDALVAQLARLHRIGDAVRVAEVMANNNYSPTAITFCPIINALAKRDISAAWRVLELMRTCNVRPNLTAFNYILTACCCVGDVAAAADVLEKMEAEGLKGDAVTYDALVLGACRAGKVEEALIVMRRAMEEGVPVLFSTYTHIMKEMLDCGYYEQASEFVMIFAGKNEKLDAELFGFQARRLKNLKRVAESKSVVEAMRKRALTVDDDLY